MTKGREILKIPPPASGGLILSYRCNSRCRHCIYGCSQRWSGDWIREEDLEIILSRLAGKIRPSLRGPGSVGLNEGLHFTGGEPFLNFELLLKAIKIASGLRIPSLFVETNCYWAENDKVTQEMLGLLKSAGLHGIMISVNPFYLEYVPFERTERAIKHSIDIFGRNVMIYQIEYYKRFKMYGIKGRMKLEDYIHIEGRDRFLREVEFFPMGRAPYALKGLIDDIYPPRPAGDFLRQPCISPPLRSMHNHFDNYRNLIPGFCGGVSIGDIKDLDELLERPVDLTDRPVLALILRGDIEGLFHLAKDYGFSEDVNGYISKCHLCTDIRKYLASRRGFPELSPLEFYTHLE